MIKNPKFSDVLNRSIFDHSGSNGNCPRDNYFNVIQNVATKYTPQQVCKVIKGTLEVKKAPNSFNMVQARKETLDHVSVQEECLNISCPKEFSLVGINRAILKKKNFGRGICKPIFLITR